MFKCFRCHEEYESLASNFSKESKNKNGYNTICKKCKSIDNKKYREDNKKEIRERRKAKYSIYGQPRSHDIYIKNFKLNPIKFRAKILRNGMLQRSKAKNIVFDSKYFSIDKIEEIISVHNKCACCNTFFIYDSNFNGSGDKNYKCPSADRFVSNIGYTKENTVFICWRCNNLKRDSSIQDLEKIIMWLENKTLTTQLD